MHFISNITDSSAHTSTKLVMKKTVILMLYLCLLSYDMRGFYYIAGRQHTWEIWTVPSGVGVHSWTELELSARGEHNPAANKEI